MIGYKPWRQMALADAQEYTRRLIYDFPTKADPLLVSVVLFADSMFHLYTEEHAIITSFIRKEGVHKTGRAADLSTLALEPHEGKIIAAAINHEFPREDWYKTALYHNTGSGYHLHLQTAPLERRAGWQRERRHT